MNQQELKRKAQKLLNDEFGYAPRLKDIDILNVTDGNEIMWVKIRHINYRISNGIVYRIYAESED